MAGRTSSQQTARTAVKPAGRSGAAVPKEASASRGASGGSRAVAKSARQKQQTPDHRRELVALVFVGVAVFISRNRMPGGDGWGKKKIGIFFTSVILALFYRVFRAPAAHEARRTIREHARK